LEVAIAVEVVLVEEEVREEPEFAEGEGEPVAETIAGQVEVIAFVAVDEVDKQPVQMDDTPLDKNPLEAAIFPYLVCPSVDIPSRS
jgi:hypothetical protein